LHLFIGSSRKNSGKKDCTDGRGQIACDALDVIEELRLSESYDYWNPHNADNHQSQYKYSVKEPQSKPLGFGGIRQLN